MLTRRRLALLAPAGLLAVGLGGVGVYRAVRTGPAGEIGGPFALEDGAGRIVTDRDFLGRAMLVYFGYTHCPDACPTALADMVSARDAMGKAGSKVALLFITIDPERDTPTVMRDYVAAFDAGIVGLSGSMEQVKQAAREYRVYFSKHVTPEGYDMDHSSIVYAMDRAGRFAAIFTHESPPAQITAELQRLVT